MKTLFLSVIVSAAIFASCNNADNKAEDVSAIMNDSSKFTAIQWLDTSINFGVKKMGDIVNITFHCKNTGNKPLYLFDVHPSCGCTLVDYSKAPISPGQTGMIEAQFDTKKSNLGEVHKTIFVRSNNTNDPRNYLSFSGTVTRADSSATAKK